MVGCNPGHNFELRRPCLLGSVVRVHRAETLSESIAVNGPLSRRILLRRERRGPRHEIVVGRARCARVKLAILRRPRARKVTHLGVSREVARAIVQEDACECMHDVARGKVGIRVPVGPLCPRLRRRARSIEGEKLLNQLRSRLVDEGTSPERLQVEVVAGACLGGCGEHGAAHL